MRAHLRSPAVALFVLALGTYAFFFQGGGYNENSRFNLVRALAEQSTVVIDDYHLNTGDKSLRDGHYYSDKAPGLAWLATPFYAVARVLGVGRSGAPADVDMGLYLATAFAVAVPSALCVAAMYLLLALWQVPPLERLAVPLLYGLGTLALPYATLFIGHQLAATLALLIFALLARQRGRETGSGLALTGGVLAGWLVLTEYQAVLLLLALGVYALFQLRPARSFTLVAAGALPCLLLLAAYHDAAFGHPLSTGYDFTTFPNVTRGTAEKDANYTAVVSTVPRPDVLAQLLWGRYRGILPYAPWLALALPGALLWWRERERRADILLCAGVGVGFLLFTSMLPAWQGGRAAGPRMYVPALPFVALMVAGCAQLARAHRLAGLLSRALLLLLGLWSVMNMLAATAVQPRVPMHIKEPYAQYLVPALIEGHLAVNITPSTAEPLPPGVTSAWNVGQLLGLSGSASLVPLLLFWMLCGLWLWRGVRAAHTPARSA
ncbi:MAG: hypothetical protein OXT09_36865 [Myxococcales bacterium]|nr:hypothetical protein [Myxococcales bacterium]